MDPVTLPFSGDPEADRFLATDPLALLLGMLLDQQVPMERAFRSPYDLKERMSGTFDAATIAAMDPEELVVHFRGPPALHRYPGSMATRTQDLCRDLVENYAGRAEVVWQGASTGAELLARLRALPGFGEQKAKIFVALLAKRVGFAPPGWQEAAGAYGQPGYFSVADIDGADALARVREHKRAVKAQARAAGSGVTAKAAGGGVTAGAAQQSVAAANAGPDPAPASAAASRGRSRRPATESPES